MDLRPFYSAEIKAFFKQLYKLLLYYEPVTVFGPDDTRWSWLLSAPDHFPELKYYSPLKLKIIDLSSSLDPELLKLPSQPDDTVKNTVLAIIGADDLLLKGETATVLNLIKYAKQNGLRYIFFLSKNILYPTRFPYLASLKADFSKNILYFPLSSETESLKFIKYLCKKFYINITANEAIRIYKECGGYFWLMKHCVRMIRDKTELRNNLLEHDDLKLKTEHVYSSFSENEKTVLKSLPCKLSQIKDYEDEIIYLMKLQWIKIKGNKITHRVKILEQFIAMLEPNNIIDLNNKSQIIINNVPVDRLFSDQERKLIIAFIGNPNIIFSKNEIAEILWGKNWLNKYSDWAIDQQISRLRKKLREIGLRANLNTIKGKGVKFNL